MKLHIKGGHKPTFGNWVRK